MTNIFCNFILLLQNSRMPIALFGQAGSSSCIASYVIFSCSWWNLLLATMEKDCKLYQEKYYGLYTHI